VLLPSVRSAFRGNRIAAPSLGCARRQIDATCRAVRLQCTLRGAVHPTFLRYVHETTLCTATDVHRACGVQLSQTTAAPLVGNVAPDFTAQAVFDQEFQEISLSSYRGKCVLLCLLTASAMFCQ